MDWLIPAVMIVAMICVLIWVTRRENGNGSKK